MAEDSKGPTGSHPEGSTGGAPTIAGLAIGRYQVKERLGAGGMGEVYRAWDTLLERWVALKRPAPGVATDGEARRRLLREARAASALEHHAIASTYDVLDFQGEPFIIQELVSGKPLRARLGAPFAIDDFLPIAIDCAEALVAAAAKGIVHCDIKPENILITEENRPKILDFGIARRRLLDQPAGTTLATATMTVSVGLTGTPSYIAPEVIMGNEPDARADIFAMGVVFYEMLAGLNPFHKENLSATLVAVARDEPAPPSAANPAISGGLDAVIVKMLAKDPAQRYESAAALLDDLKRIRDGLRPTVHIARPKPRRKVGILIGGAVAVVVIALVVVFGGGLRVTRTAAAGRYLAVEQFKNLAEDSKFEFFAVGLTEAVQARLAGLKGIYVVEAGSEIGATLTLKGNVQRSSNELRISYTVMDQGASVGGGEVEGNISDLFAVQDSVVNRICQTLNEVYGLAPLSEPSERPTRDALAYDTYLQARGYLHKYQDEKNVEIAIEMFQKALERDPEFPLALAGLGQAYWRRYEATRDPLWVEKAEEVSQSALSLGPNLAEPHVTLGTLYNGTGKFDSAAREFRRAIELDPKGDDGYSGLATAEEGLGRLDAAEAAFTQAITARPDYWGSHKELGKFYFKHGRYEEALTMFEKVVELTPDNALGYSNLGAVFQALGRDAEAITALERSVALRPNHRAYSNLATLYRAQGRPKEAAENYEAALRLNDRDYRIWGSLGGTYMDIPGRKASADSALDRAIELGERQREVNPNDPLLLALLGQYYAQRKLAADARQLTQRALSLAPEQTEVLHLAIGAYELLGDRKSALDTVRKALEAGYPIESLKTERLLESLVADPEFTRIENEVAAAAGKEGA